MLELFGVTWDGSEVSVQELADFCGVTRRAIYNVEAKALERLRKRIRKELA